MLEHWHAGLLGPGNTRSSFVHSFHPRQNLTDQRFIPLTHFLQGQSQFSRQCRPQNWKSRFSVSQCDLSKNGRVAGFPCEGRGRGKGT